jgi:hypothetical protein
MSVAKLTYGFTLLIGLGLTACASSPPVAKANKGFEKSALELINEAPAQRANQSSCAAQHLTLVCESSGFSGPSRLDRCSCMDPQEIRTLFVR